jgi:hypothetical protein
MCACLIASPAPLSPYPPPRLAVALAVLHQACDYATELGVVPWEFAVDRDDLSRAGATHNDLRWLIARGLLEHGLEKTRANDPRRTFQCPGGRLLRERSCFVLSALGLAWAERFVRDATHAGSREEQNGRLLPIGDRPHWDADRRELSFREGGLKRFRSPAPNQERVLAAFEEDGWPPRIDDPLPPQADQDSKRRLRDTIATLNRGQKGIRFSADGLGQGVCWQAVEHE